jgi:WD40 repeat protein
MLYLRDRRGQRPARFALLLLLLLLLQVLLSAGWDATVQVWDLRVGHSVRSMAGGSWVCGDGLDVQGSRVLTASWRDRQPLQVGFRVC